MDKAYEDELTRKVAHGNAHPPVVPPRSNRVAAWEYDKETYRKRNVVERLFRNVKAFRRVCTRYDKTDIIFMAFVNFALIMLLLR